MIIVRLHYLHICCYLSLDPKTPYATMQPQLLYIVQARCCLFLTAISYTEEPDGILIPRFRSRHPCSLTRGHVNVMHRRSSKRLSLRLSRCVVHGYGPRSRCYECGSRWRYLRGYRLGLNNSLILIRTRKCFV